MKGSQFHTPASRPIKGFNESFRLRLSYSVAVSIDGLGTYSKLAQSNPACSFDQVSKRLFSFQDNKLESRH